MVVFGGSDWRASVPHADSPPVEAPILGVPKTPKNFAGGNARFSGLSARTLRCEFCCVECVPNVSAVTDVPACDAWYGQLMVVHHRPRRVAASDCAAQRIHNASTRAAARLSGRNARRRTSAPHRSEQRKTNNGDT